MWSHWHPFFPKIKTAQELKTTGAICSNALPIYAVLGSEDKKSEGPLRLITWDIMDSRKPNVFGDFFKDKKNNAERLSNVKKALDRFQAELKPDLILLQNVETEHEALNFKEDKDEGIIVYKEAGLVVLYNPKQFELDVPEYMSLKNENDVLYLELKNRKTQKCVTVHNVAFHSPSQYATHPFKIVASYVTGHNVSAASLEHQIIIGGAFNVPIMTPSQKNLVTSLVLERGEVRGAWTHGVVYANHPKVIHQPAKITVLRTAESGPLEEADSPPILNKHPLSAKPFPYLWLPIESTLTVPEINGVRGHYTAKGYLFQPSTNAANQRGFLYETHEQRLFNPDLGDLIFAVTESESSFDRSAQLLLPERLLADFKLTITRKKYADRENIQAILHEATRLLENQTTAHRPYVARALFHALNYVKAHDSEFARNNLKREADRTLGAPQPLKKLYGLLFILLGCAMFGLSVAGAVTGIGGIVGPIGLGTAGCGFITAGTAYLFFKNRERNKRDFLSAVLDQELKAPSFETEAKGAGPEDEKRIPPLSSSA